MDSNSSVVFSSLDLKVSNLSRGVSLTKLASTDDSNSFIDLFGNCYLAGFFNSSVLFLAKFDSNGNLIFNTTFGDIGVGSISDFTVDNNSNSYFDIFTHSSNVSTMNAFNTSYGGGGDVVVAKFNSTGGLIFSTYLGGSSYDESSDISVASNGDIYVTGYTLSANFPTFNAFNSTFGGGNVFVTKFNATGSLIFSTYLGSYLNEFERDIVDDKIAVDSNGNIYVTGETDSSFFPTKNAFQTSYGGGIDDIFVTKLNSTGGLVFSTYIGGNSSEIPSNIAVDSNGNSFVTGVTSSTDFPTKNAFNANYKGGDTDIFVTKFNSTGGMLFSTYLGGSNFDLVNDLTTDSAGNCYITGITNSTDFYTLNAFNASYNGGISDAFVTKFNSAGVIVFSTFLGGNGDDSASDISVDYSGTVYVAGLTTSNNFPTINAFNSVYSGGTDAFLTKFTSTGTMVYSTYFGGTDHEYSVKLSVDGSGESFLSGITFSNNFPVVNAYQQTLVGSSSYFVSKFTTQGGLIFSTYFGSLAYALSSPSTTINQFTYPISNPTNGIGNIIDSSTSLTNSVSYLLYNYSYLILPGIIDFLVLFLFSVVEYINYKKSKLSSKQKSHSSFLNYIKKSLTRRFRSEPGPPQLSNSTFDLLEEIEKENTPDN